MKVHITREAYRILYDATVERVPGPYVATDLNTVEADLTPEVVAWLEEYTQPGENISNTVTRLSQLVELMRSGRVS
jgi:hypothetical protein